MAIGNELLQECFPKQERMGTARMKQDKETEEGSKAWVYGKMKSGHKIISPVSAMIIHY